MGFKIIIFLFCFLRYSSFSFLWETSISRGIFYYKCHKRIRKMISFHVCFISFFVITSIFLFFMTFSVFLFFFIIYFFIVNQMMIWRTIFLSTHSSLKVVMKKVIIYISFFITTFVIQCFIFNNFFFKMLLETKFLENTCMNACLKLIVLFTYKRN